MKQDFVHLHNHTDFSLLDGAQSLDQMCNRLTDLKMDTIAVTEHGNLFSMIPFYKKAIKQGIKPILGCDLSHTPRSIIARASARVGYSVYPISSGHS